MRLNKFVQKALGISRRAAERLIFEGRVSINGEVKKEPFYDTQNNDKIFLDKKHIQITEEPFEVYIYYKPRGVISTLKDRHAEKTVQTELELKKGFKFAGRLDKNSEGLMIITNNGGLIHRLTHPSFEVKKGYLVWTKRPITPREITAMLHGIKDRDDILKPDTIERKGEKLYLFVLHEGKKREIRRIVKRFNNEVIRLKRIFMDNFKLPSDLKPGEIRKVG